MTYTHISFGGLSMEKPVVYIMVEGGLVQSVYLKSLYGANAEVVICDFDTTDDTELAINLKTVEEAQKTAHLIY
jgi:hypothetical protein